MDSSKILPATEECSSSESGWTMYIASPDLDHDHDYGENEDDDVDLVGRGEQGYKKAAQIEEAAADSDDSMASDASSGPSDQRYSYGLGHAGSNNERKSAAKKHNQREEKKKHTMIKGEKDKSCNKANTVTGGGRLKKF